MTISQRSPAARMKRQRRRHIRRYSEICNELQEMRQKHPEESCYGHAKEFRVAIRQLITAAKYAEADISRKPGDPGPTPGVIAEMLRSAGKAVEGFLR